MNLAFLDYGMAGVLEAGLIALLVGVLAQVLVRVLLTRRIGWSDGHEIGWAYLAALVAGCGVDIWHLFHMFIVPMQSPVSIRRVLAGIHDPDYLGMRVFVEMVTAGIGVFLGWWLSGRLARRQTAGSAQDRE